MNTFRKLHNLLFEAGGESPRLDPEALTKSKSWHAKETKRTFPSVARRKKPSRQGTRASKRTRTETPGRKIRKAQQKFRETFPRIAAGARRHKALKKEADIETKAFRRHAGK